MLSLTVKLGHVLRLGDVAAIKVVEKTGRRVRLDIYSDISPINIIETGIVPAYFTTGITGRARMERMTA